MYGINPGPTLPETNMEPYIAISRKDSKQSFLALLGILYQFGGGYWHGYMDP